MGTVTVENRTAERSPRTQRASYPLRSRALAGGPYNSHLASLAVFSGLTAVGLMDGLLFVWLCGSLAAALLLDQRTWQRKLRLDALPSQAALYSQVLLQAAWDALPPYCLAFALYVCTVHWVAPTDLAISSFALLYGFYLALRSAMVVYYVARLHLRWPGPGRTFKQHAANLRTASTATRHVLWAYFLGNVGLVVRCGIQVTTLAGFEWLRQRAGLDLTQIPAVQAHLTGIFVVAAIVWLATLWWAIKRALLIYYRTHRTFHESPALYSGIHAIHHRGVLPTPLDSGTISPAEFWITEMAVPSAALLPNWWFAAVQIVLAFAGHLPSHNAGTHLSFSQHHLRHHRHLRVNLGLTPAEDAEFGTLFTTETQTS